VNVRIAVPAVIVAMTAALAAPPGVYHADPNHLWNRLHEALFVRVDGSGQEYGRDRFEPLLWRGSRHLLGGDSHRRLLSVLAEFNRSGAADIQDPLERAMLQRDLWLVFSWLEYSHDDFYGFPGSKATWRAGQESLRQPLARAIASLAMTPRQLASLPDNYAAAVASHAFAERLDPRQPGRPYLPPDLFAADGPWICLGRGDDLIAPAHVLADNPFTTSAFLVFIKLPGGRTATRAYVERLRAFTAPVIRVHAASSQQPFPDYNPDLPQFPAGTEVALVRRALLVSSTFEIVASPLTESVQVRVYREVPAWTPDMPLRAFNENTVSRPWQSFYEYTVSRRPLFAGDAGGLHAATADDRFFLTGPSTHGSDPFDERPDGQPFIGPRSRGSAASSGQPLASDWCVSCHALPGAYSVNTITQAFSGESRRPLTRLSDSPVAAVVASAVAWKQKRADWILLQRLLRQPAAAGR
jgi:hypothetical protein